MLCPETWRFAPPKSNYREYKRNVHEDNDNQSILNINYAHLVSVVLPNTHAPTTINKILSVDCDYYKIENISLGEFINKEFINKFVKSGELSALSINTKLDLDNCVCVTADGLLILHLDKVSYEELGVEGRVSHFTSRKNKYIVEIELKNLSTNAQFDRVRISLSERLNKFTLIVSWAPPDPTICPSSIAKYFSDLNYGVFLCQPKHSTKNRRQVQVPFIDESDDLIEWLGMFTLEADLSTGKYDNYVNTYECPEDSTLCENVCYMEWKGFYTTQQIQQLYNYLIKYVQRISVPWISMYVQGFSDSPISCNLNENNFHTNSENAFAYFLKPDGNYLLCTQLQSNKRNK